MQITFDAWKNENVSEMIGANNQTSAMKKHYFNI